MGHSLNWDAFLGFVERMGFCQWQWTATPCHAMLFLSAMEATLGLEDWIPASTASHGRRAGDSEVMPKRKKLWSLLECFGVRDARTAATATAAAVAAAAAVILSAMESSSGLI
ncbi:hypothetical protein AXG93_1474s1100 [Marchantia polymorpha subsp. ruderalis]|uniref:Uncharacterized protein n=1 Tax=Marchantia polymorpha subsp. ruderalis TaxID=1480154 RepID=A0A176WAR7_MARPO|nr:hypothetical protein AXG93_1474s1100 [Marchantia polymorpha subsp. ruderalis]